MTVVHHYYPMGSENTGDALVARCIHAALRRHLDVERIIEMPVNDRWRSGDRTLGLRGENLDRTNREADLVVIGGSNLVEPRRHGRWGVFTDVASIERLRPPLLLVGMGTGSDFARRIRRYREPAISEVRTLHAKALASTVRDITTQQRLDAIGVHSPATCCPVMCLTDHPVTAGSPDQPLLVSFPPPRIEKQFRGRAFMRAAMNYIRWLRDRRVDLVVTLHDTRDVEPARQRVPEGVEIVMPPDYDALVDRFGRCRGVIGFRLHAALLGLGLGKPVIPVGLDWRALGFIRTFGIDDVSIRSLRLSQFSKLRALTERLLQGDPTLVDRLQQAKAAGCRRHQKWWRDAAAQLTSLRQGTCTDGSDGGP